MDLELSKPSLLPLDQIDLSPIIAAAETVVHKVFDLGHSSDDDGSEFIFDAVMKAFYGPSFFELYMDAIESHD